MLSIADDRLAGNDPAIPGLGAVLDPDLLRSMIERRYPDRTFGEARIHYVRYKPATLCIAGFRIEIDGAWKDLYAQAFSPSDVHKAAKALSRDMASSTLDPGRFLDEETMVLVSAFPNDTRLRALARLEPSNVAGFLKAIAPERKKLRRAQLTSLSWKPERRFVGRLDVDGTPAATLRLYEPAGWAAAHESTMTLQGSSLRLPRVIAASQRHRALLLDWVQGTPFQEAIAGEAVRRAACERAGAALAAFHRMSPVTSLRVPAVGRIVEGLRDLGRWISAVEPGSREVAGRCARTLAHAIDALEPGAMVPIHGDFYAGQLLFSDGRIRILDLDEASLGDPLQDLANFAAHLDRDVILGRRAPAEAEVCVQALLEGYRAGGGVQPDERRLATHRAVALFRLVPEPFRRRHDRWDVEIRDLLLRVDRILEAEGLDARVRRAKRPRASLDELVDQAVDPRSIRRLVGGALETESVRVRVDRAFLVRRKGNRRAMVEYQLTVGDPGRETRQTLLGKIRAKGLDRTTFATCCELRSAGFREPSRVALPEPVAMVPALSMWLQRKVDGVSSTSLLLGPDARELAVRIAEAAWSLHRSPSNPVRRHSIDDELAVLQDRLEALASESPVWHRTVEALVALALSWRDVLAARPVATIHRDFYPDHVLVDGERLWIVDFDLWCLGDPAIDIGNFIAHLEEFALRKTGDPNAASAGVESLVRRYLELAGDEHREAIRGYTGLSLARLVGISRTFEDRRELTSMLADHAEARLAVSRRPITAGVAMPRGSESKESLHT